MDITRSHVVVAGIALVALSAGCAELLEGDTPGPAAPEIEGAGLAELPCSADEREEVIYDYAGPGRITPAKAVAGLIGAVTVGSTRWDADGSHATVTVLDAEGAVMREYRVRKARDGWWVDGYTTCASTESDVSGQSGEPAPPTESQQVGINGVAVAVPEEWRGSGDACQVSFGDTYSFSAPDACLAGGRSPRAASIEISTEDPQTGRLIDDHRLDRRPVGEVAGHEIVGSEMLCTGKDGFCTQVVGVPDLDAYFDVTVPQDADAAARIQSILFSLVALPEHETVVPITALRGEERVRRAIERSGLVVEVDRVICPPNAGCLFGVTGSEPSPGTVVPVGSTVTITVMGAAARR